MWGIQTSKHTLNNCSSPAVLERNKQRHDKILVNLSNWIKSHLKAEAKLFVDLPQHGYLPTSHVFNNFRPDIAVYHDKMIHILELTIPHETNLKNSCDYKSSKYANLAQNLTQDFRSVSTVNVHTVEVSSLGLISEFNKFCKATMTVNKLDHFDIKNLQEFF